MARPKIPGGSMTIHKARARWDDVRRAAQLGDPAAMLDAVSRFEGIADTMFLKWEDQPNDY